MAGKKKETTIVKDVEKTEPEATENLAEETTTSEPEANKERTGTKNKNSAKDLIEGRIPVRCIQNMSAFDKGKKYLVSERVFTKYNQLFERITSEEYNKVEVKSKIMSRR